MKNIVFILLCAYGFLYLPKGHVQNFEFQSFQSNAGDVIFINGFENIPLCLNTNMLADCIPDFASVQLYQSQSIWNTIIPPNSTLANNQSGLLQSLIDAGNMVIQVRQYSAPAYFVDNNTPMYNVDLACAGSFGLGVDQLMQVPIPDYAIPSDDVDGASNPIPPLACGEDSDQDNHMLIVDLVNRCEYSLWQARKINGNWIASFASGISIDGSGIYPGGISTRGSGLPFLAGMIWPDELADGVINHALAFSYPLTKSGGPVAPATASDGVTNSVNAIPIGAKIRLDPDLDLNTLTLTDYEMTIAKALQIYGMYLVDTGGDSSLGLYAIDPKSTSGNMYDGLLPDVDFVLLGGIPINNLQILEYGAQIGNANDLSYLANDLCSIYQ